MVKIVCKNCNSIIKSGLDEYISTRGSMYCRICGWTGNYEVVVYGKGDERGVVKNG